MFKPLRIPSYLHPYPLDFFKYLPRFSGEDHLTAERHLGAFESFVDQFEIVHEDVTMRLFSKYLFGDVVVWFKGLGVDSIGSWIELCNAFLKCWGENKSLDQYLVDFNALRRGEEEALVVFNMRFYSVYHSMPLEIRPSETASIVYYVMAQHPDLVLLLRERKSSSLRRLFEDVEEVEENIWACKRIRDQAYFENLHAHEQQDCEYISDLEQQECKYESDLGQHLTVSSKYSDFSMDRDVHYAYNQFPKHFEHTVTNDCIDNYMFLVDHFQYVLNHVVQLSYDHYSEEEIVSPDDQELILKGQEGYLFSSKGEGMHEQLSFLNQHISNYGFEDPVASLLESYFLDSLKVSDFIISPTFVGEYGFLKESISLLLCSCYYLLISSRDEIISV
jgi:hypothetical protein